MQAVCVLSANSLCLLKKRAKGKDRQYKCKKKIKNQAQRGSKKKIVMEIIVHYYMAASLLSFSHIKSQKEFSASIYVIM